MAADRRTRAGVALLAVVAAALPPAGAARAQAVYGYATGQYQRVEQMTQVPGSDLWTRTAREFWLQTYELNNQSYLRSNLQLLSTLRLTDLAYVNLPDASRAPSGSLRLTHSLFSVFASHQPTETTSGFNAGGVSAPGDATRLLSVTSKTQNTQLGGSFFAAKLPRLDVSWIRRHRDADVLGNAETSVNRNARAAYDRGPLSLYASLGDQRRDPLVPAAVITTQRVATAGGAMTVSPFRAASLAMQYDFGDTRNQSNGITNAVTRTNGGSLSGDWRPNRLADVSLSYVVRSATTTTVRADRSTSQDGSLYLNLTPNKSVRLATGGGVRTSVAADGSQDLLSYATAVLSGQGTVRPGWTAVGSAAHTSNWDPTRGAFWVEALRGSSRMRLAKGLDVESNLFLSANGDTAARDQRWTTDASARVTATPLRTLTLGYGARTYRVGAQLTTASGRSLSQTLDLRWKVATSLEMVGSYSESGALPNNDPRSVLRVATLRWSPVPKWQVSGNWSRSDQTRVDAVANQIAGREIAGVRVLGALTRRLVFNGGASIADRGQPTENRQYDGSLTMTFGR